MTHSEIFQFSILAGMETLLCILVFWRRLQKRLPFFAVYAATMLACSIFLSLVYGIFGFRTSVSFYFAWLVTAVIMLARTAAVVELCRESLRFYPGIWSLTWRLLVIIAAVFLVHAALDAQGQTHWIAAYGWTVEGDIELASVFILVTILLISSYYHLPKVSFQMMLAAGICLFCVIEFVNNLVAQHVFVRYLSSWSAMRSEVDHALGIWNWIQSVAGNVSLVVWCFALRKPLPEPATAPVLLPPEVYGELSPAINLRLRAFNDRLTELLKT